MARLLLALTFLVLVALTKGVSAYRATVTTVVVDDEENPRTICRERVHVHDLLHCRQYLSRERQILAMSGEINELERRQKQLQECCQQLRQVEERCRCEGIRMVVREQCQREKLQGLELREMVMRAQDLPSMCRVPMQQRCKIDEGGKAEGY